MKIDNTDIYEKIGNLFYAIARDQHVKMIEVGELKMIISKDWLPRNLQSEVMISGEAHTIMITIDTLQGEDITAGEAYKEFATFYGLYPQVFTPELKHQIFDTACEIVRVFKADNTASNKHFEEMKKLLQLPETAQI